MDDFFPNWVNNKPRDGSATHPIRVFGSMSDPYAKILEDIVHYLQENGYHNTKIAPSRQNDSTKPSRPVEAMENAYGAIFIMFDNNRSVNTSVERLNSATTTNLAYWNKHFMEKKRRTLIIYEGDAVKIGTKLSDLVGLSGMIDFHTTTSNIQQMKERSLVVCTEWLQ